MTRPFTTFDDPFYPTTMDSLLRAMGAEPVDWALKTRCCGGSLTGTIQEAGLRLNRALLKEISKHRADIAVTCCPLCQHNLECYQGRINRQYNEDLHVPIAYFTQLMGLALGIPDKELGIQRLFHPIPHPAPGGRRPPMSDQSTNGAPRIGFYVCHCGHNIAGIVDVHAVAEAVARLPQVVVSREYKYMCSDPGQELIQQDIREHHLNRIVVASCSPLLHEHTFRTATENGGLNAYHFHMVNIRENVSWVHTDRDAATRKAIDLARAAILRVQHHKPLQNRKVRIHPDVLVVGGGIAGIHAALTLANAGKKVYLVEREPTIGGHMAMFDKTFPTLDCAACILTPKMSAGEEPPEHHPLVVFGGVRARGVRRQLPGHRAPEAPLHQRGSLRRLHGVRRGLRLQRGPHARRVQRRP